MRIIIIPARLESKRLHRKLLLPGPGGKPLLYFTWKQALGSNADEIYVATDSTEIAQEATKFGADVIMTKTTHNCGTSRIEEAYSKLPHSSSGSSSNCIINLQGDEPEIRKEDINLLMEKFEDWSSDTERSWEIATLAVPFHDFYQYSLSQNVKVVFDDWNYIAIYFSRGMIPWVPLAEWSYRMPKGDKQQGTIAEWRTGTEKPIAYKHLGIYAYTPKNLEEFACAEPTRLEKIERLEQMRAIENQWPILVVPVEAPDDDPLNIWPLSINTDEDYKLWHKRMLIRCQK